MSTAPGGSRQVIVDGPVQFNPYAHAVHDDPFPFYERLRDEAPLYRNDELGFWALSRYDDVLEALHDHGTYSSADGITLEPRSPLPMLITFDPPEHTVMRRLVSRTFTPRRIADLEPRIRDLSQQYLSAFEGRHTGDLIGEYTAKLPMDVISTMLGAPPADQDMLRGWTDDLIHREEDSPDVTPTGIEAAIHLYQYFTELTKEKRADPGDDLLSGLTLAEVDGERLTNDDIVAFCVLLVIAGNETTTKLIGNAAFWLWRNPDQRRLLLDDPGRIPDAVEETLRYEGSTQIMARTTTRPVDLHGAVIPEGDKVLLLLGAGNRDPRFWDRPDEYDLDREKKLHLSFGHGVHVCLGAALARMETRISLEHLLARFGEYDVDAAGIERVHSGSVRGYSCLPISW